MSSIRPAEARQRAARLAEAGVDYLGMRVSRGTGGGGRDARHHVRRHEGDPDHAALILGIERLPAPPMLSEIVRENNPARPHCRVSRRQRPAALASRRFNRQPVESVKRSIPQRRSFRTRPGSVTSMPASTKGVASLSEGIVPHRLSAEQAPEIGRKPWRHNGLMSRPPCVSGDGCGSGSRSRRSGRADSRPGYPR
ncbi:hypothetical protein [Jiella avicenniae]|uniref:hypothetical protein n=1 Tax=Jiella avicenniae TaxID=2907202 RepID=UPI003B847ABB